MKAWSLIKDREQYGHYTNEITSINRTNSQNYCEFEATTDRLIKIKIFLSDESILIKMTHEAQLYQLKTRNLIQ